jgi:hypothetical protein
VIAQQIAGGPKGYFLPGDPRIMGVSGKPYFDEKTDEIIYPNFTQGREIKKYTKFVCRRVESIIESIFLLILAYSIVRTK